MQINAISRRLQEIKLRAERRAGELLRGMEKAKGIQLNGTRRSHDETTATLTDLGVTKSQSHRWQTEADTTTEDETNAH